MGRKYSRRELRENSLTQRPRAVMNASAIETRSMSSIEAVAFKEKERQRLRLCWRENFTPPPDHLKIGWMSVPAGARGGKVNGWAFFLQSHPRLKIGKEISQTGAHDSKEIRGVKREKPY